MEFEAIQRVLAAFEREGVASPTRGNIDRLRAALHSVFDDPSIDEITAEDILGDYSAIQYVPPAGTFHLDLLTRLGEAFSFDDLEVVRVPFGAVTVSVVTPRTLYLMKRDTLRLKDKADAALLKARFSLEDD